MFSHPKVTEIVSPFPMGQVVLFLIRGKQNALIDTGSVNTPDADLLPALKKLGMKLSDINIVLNTHGHFDHTGGDSALKAAGAKIYIHPKEASQINDRKTHVKEFYGPLVTKLLGKEHITHEWEEFVGIGGPEVTVDKLIDEGDVIDLGNDCKLKVLLLDGHTPGSIGFYWEKEGILFAGDALPGLHDAGCGLPIVTDLTAFKKTLSRLKKMPIKYLFIAHEMRCLSSPWSYKKQGKDVNGYLDDCMDFANSIIEAVKKAPKLAKGEPVANIYDNVVENLPAKFGFKKRKEVGNIMLSTAVILSALQLNGLYK